jgi:hypothetical protein
MGYLPETVRTGNFDNLQAWRVYLLADAATTVDGHAYPAGTEFRFEYAVVTLKTRDAIVHGETPEGARLVFSVRDYAHRKLFVDTGREWRPQKPIPAVRPPRLSPSPPQPPPPAAKNRADSPQALWLARQPEFAQISAIVSSGSQRAPSNWGSAREDADTLRRAALALEPTQLAVAAWLADRSLDLYHFWMSQATSGGEGTAMEGEIRRELAEMRRLKERIAPG